MKKHLPIIGFFVWLAIGLFVIPSLQGCANYNYNFNKTHLQE